MLGLKLAEKFGPTRAAWIAKQFTPLRSGEAPNPGTHDQAWSRASITQILPTRWIALVYEDGKSEPIVSKGENIAQPLTVGLYPKAKETNKADLNADNFENDPELGWLVEFSKAKEKGMGIIIPKDKIPTSKIKRIVVLGVNSDFKGDQGQQKLEDLINAHHYTQGIGFILQGTPTNNTDDAPSGFSTLDPGFEKSFRVERQVINPPLESSHRVVAARALGIKDSLFEHVRESAAQEQLDAQHMNTALWQATWGSFLEHMMAGPNAPTDEKLQQGREHFQRYVRGRGPLPALRIGKQPYGLLPVISIDKLDESLKKSINNQSVDPQLVDFLRKLREVWQHFLVNVPQIVSENTVKKDKKHFKEELLKVLEMTPTSVEYVKRPAQRIAQRAPQPSSDAYFSGNQTTKDLVQKLGLNWIPRQIRMVYGDALHESQWPDSIISSNLLKNHNFDGTEGQTSTFDKKDAGSSSAAEEWRVWNSVDGIITTELVRSTFPYGGSMTMIHVTTAGIHSGLVQKFLLENTGPSRIIASAWVFVKRGHVGIGTGNGGATNNTDAVSKTTGQWEYLEASNSISPANEFIIYSDNQTEDGADFYVAEASVVEIPKFYCDWLFTESHSMLWQKKLNGVSDTLFHRLVREACLREYLNAACRILKLSNPNEDCIEPEFEDDNVSTLRNKLDRPVSSGNPEKIGDYLDKIKKELKNTGYNLEKIPEAQNLKQQLSNFAAFYKSLDYLVIQPSNSLEALVKETLDLCSHRYDAWVTSFATKRLDTLRKQKPTGVYIGGYGWVENLEPIKRELINPPKECEHNSSLPLYKSDSDNGYIHAPSLAHATTAALLRSGYALHKNPFDKNNQDQNSFAINLSSERVRLAQRLMDGVRQGQSLSSLLGYRFERGLHENYPGLGIPLDQYIPFFRKISLLDMAPFASISKEDINARSARQVVDGLGLLHKWQKIWNKEIPWDKYPAPTPPDNHKEACENELRRLEDAIDAISDLVIAESVHHVAQGNPVRAGATLAAITEGEATPPELDVISTPRSGIAITHRIAVAFSGDFPSSSSLGEPWESTPRAQVEPFLNAWLAKLLGGPKAKDAQCAVEFRGQDSSDKNKTILLDTKNIELKQLKLAPIDLLYLSEYAGETQHSELEQRIIYEAQCAISAENLSKTTEIRLSFSNELTQGNVGFAELLEIARAARKLIVSARPLQTSDLDQPGGKEQKSDTVELGARADNAVEQFKNKKKTLEEAISSESNLDSKKIRDALMLFANYGLVGTVPLNLVGDAPEVLTTLRAQAESVLYEVEERIKRINSVTKNQANGQDYHLTRLREVFGTEFRIMPRFNPVNFEDLNATFARSLDLQRGNPLTSVTWFQRASRVRDGVARLDKILLYAEALGNTELNLAVGQLPYKENEQWVALPLESEELPGSRISLVVHEPLGIVSDNIFSIKQPTAGLMIDEWVEVIPNKKETPGLAFHYDAPQSRAPQAILLAVAPEGIEKWDLATLEATIVETLELAKLRAVDLKAWGDEANQFLPALYFPQSRIPE